jgi:hypothetical protein
MKRDELVELAKLLIHWASHFSPDEETTDACLSIAVDALTRAQEMTSGTKEQLEILHLPF